MKKGFAGSSSGSHAICRNLIRVSPTDYSFRISWGARFLDYFLPPARFRLLGNTSCSAALLLASRILRAYSLLFSFAAEAQHHLGRES